MTTPQPRPALRRADDAGVHPALAVAPSQAPPALRPRPVAAEPPEPGAGRPKAKPDKAKGKTKGKNAKAQVAEQRQPLRSAGHTTSDALRLSGSKRVTLQVRVPKSTRKQLRAVAKHSGTSVDELVVSALNDWLGDPRRW